MYWYWAFLDTAKTIAAIPPIKVMGAIKTSQPDLSKKCIRGTVTVAIGIKVAKK
jgi:hypothetical protein